MINLLNQISFGVNSATRIPYRIIIIVHYRLHIFVPKY